MCKIPPLVSVIIPCYNVSAFVEEAINSILSQTYSNLEVWIIDDGSSDNTLDKIQSIKDERIKIVAFKENTKKIGAVNDILKRVNGDLIAFQDADDFSALTRIEEQVKQFKNNQNLCICFTNYTYIGSEKNQLKIISLSDSQLKNEFFNFRNKDNDLEMSPTVCGTMMISKESLQKTLGYHPYFMGKVAEDIHWIYRILKCGTGITINKSLYNYRKREGSFTQIQSAGKNAKYAYSWQLVAKIIYKDKNENIDLLMPENKELLKEAELEACEEALLESIQNCLKQKYAYENSKSFLIGKLVLSPLHKLTNLLNKIK